VAAAVPLRIEITKRSDGGGVLRCVRPDGSYTWQRQDRHAPHFALHDLTHFAVETTLGFRQGFFGLIAAGWDIEDTTGKGARGSLPDEALEVERIVGLLDAERAGATIWPVDEFNLRRGRHLIEEEIERVRARRAELFAQWSAVQPGGKIELNFDESLWAISVGHRALGHFERSNAGKADAQEPIAESQ